MNELLRKVIVSEILDDDNTYRNVYDYLNHMLNNLHLKSNSISDDYYYISNTIVIQIGHVEQMIYFSDVITQEIQKLSNYDYSECYIVANYYIKKHFSFDYYKVV